MTAICGILRESFEDYLLDALPSPQRRILREHLDACPECRELAAARDVTFLFARPLREAVSAGEAEQILSTVRTGVALLEAERRIGRGVRRRTGGVAAAAAVVALVLAMRGGPAPRAPEVAVLPTPPAAAESEPTVLGPAALPAEASPSSSATVYDLNPGAGREEPRVVWIVDRGLDI